MLEILTDMHIKYPLPLFNFNQNWNVPIDFSKLPSMKLNGNQFMHFKCSMHIDK